MTTEILAPSPRPVKLGVVLEAIDNATRENLIAYLGTVAGYRVNIHDPNDARRKTKAEELATALADPETVTGFAVEFLRLHAETIAHNGGFE